MISGNAGSIRHDIPPTPAAVTQAAASMPGRQILGDGHASILIVDDSPSDQLLLKELLNAGQKPYQYLYADTCNGAAKLIATQSPDCVLLDYWLPDGNAAELIDQCNILSPNIPIIVVTCETDAYISVEVMKAGAQDFFIKNRVRSQDLQKAVTSALRSSGDTGLRHRGTLPVDSSEHAVLLVRQHDGVLIDLVDAGLLPGTDGETLCGQVLDDAIALPRGQQWRDVIRRAADTRQPEMLVLTHAEGHRVVVELSARLTQMQGEDFAFVTLRDVSRHKRRIARLVEMAYYDELTGVRNRRAFDLEARRALANASRGRFPLGVMMIDIDHFKAFNDQHGHLAGDRCLRQVAGAIERALREDSDIVARYGGEEFSVVLVDADATVNRTVAARILEQVRALNITDEQGQEYGPIRISVGHVSVYPDRHATVKQITALADEALYRAKRAGRDRACEYVDVQSTAQDGMT